MGVRITAFGVNVEDLEAALAEPMSTHLLRWMAVAEDEYLPTLDCWDHANRLHYFAWLGQGIFVREMPSQEKHSASRERIEETKVDEIEFLRVPAIDYLRAGSSFDLCRFLRLLASDPDRDAFLITDGLKRAWVYSLLDVVSSTYLLADEDKNTIDRMIRKLLRLYYGSGPKFKDKIKIADFNLPIIPQDDGDKEMGVWDDEEIVTFTRVAETLRDTGVRFSRPRRLRSDPKDDVDWNEWVWRMIDQFDATRWTTPRIDRVATFIC